MVTKMEERKNSVVTICPSGNKYLQIKASDDTKTISSCIAFEACIVDTPQGNADAEPFMYQILNYIYVPKGYGSETAYIMDSESAEWGEIGFQMFGDGSRRARFVPGSVLLLNSDTTRGGIVDNEVIFSDQFDMGAFIAALMRTAAMLHPKERAFDYFTFWGNDSCCPDDAKWRKKMRTMDTVTYVRMTRQYVCAVPGCFLCVWDAAKNKVAPAVTCIKRGTLPWRDYASAEPI